jgi:hypothetical protein
MSNEFEREWSCWEDGMTPSSRLIYLFGRYLKEEKWTVREGYLTRARISDRGFNFQKDDTGFTFEITRHPNAFRNPDCFAVKRIVQKWKVSLQDRIVEFVEERKWTENDPE